MTGVAAAGPTTGVRRVAVVTTGGTIASTRGGDGAATPTVSGADLVGPLAPAGVEVRVVDLFAKDSSSLDLADMQRVSDTVGELLAGESEDADAAVGAAAGIGSDSRAASRIGGARVDGVVVVHGTDTMEETALLVALQHGRAARGRPVVFTGAQFTADSPDADGPANLALAIRAAAGLAGDARVEALEDAEGAEGREDGGGRSAPAVSIAFGGSIVPAWGAVKTSSDRAEAFASAVAGAGAPAGIRIAPSIAGARVDVVAFAPGMDGALLHASVAAGACGIVLVALGSGNANADVVDAVRAVAASGVPVVVSSRVPFGELAAAYGGGGGGHDLVAAGAALSRVLRPGQARILLAGLVARGADTEEIRAAFA